MREEDSDIIARGSSAEESRASRKCIPEPQSGNETNQYKLPWRPGKQERTSAEQSAEAGDRGKASSSTSLQHVSILKPSVRFYFMRSVERVLICKDSDGRKESS